MQDNYICYGILAALVSLLVLIAKNGYALTIIATALSKMIANDLASREEYRCRYEKECKDARQKENNK